jgi:hypothetical protein
MKRSRTALAIAVFTVALAFPLAARATGDSVGLGLSLGVALPQGSTANISSIDWQPSFDWGFYVNIPLIATFHLTPSAELYKLADQNATDLVRPRTDHGVGCDGFPCRRSGGVLFPADQQPRPLHAGEVHLPLRGRPEHPGAPHQRRDPLQVLSVCAERVSRLSLSIEEELEYTGTAGICSLKQEKQKMKLTVEQVAKMTKLSTATVRLYASRKKLGTKEGNRRYFSKKDVEELTGSSSSASRKSKAASNAAQKGKPAGKKAVAKKPGAKKATRKRLPKAASASVTAEAKGKPAAKLEPRVEKRSFWALFRRQPRQKVALLDAKVKK